MGEVAIGVNLEFARAQDASFEEAMRTAAELGFEYVEPMVHLGREVLSLGGYFHSVSLLDDPLRVRDAAQQNGLRLSALSSHCPLRRPDVSTEFLKQAVRFAAECGAPMVVTDDGVTGPSFTGPVEDRALMRYVLKEAAAVAEPRGVMIGIEQHGPYTSTPEGHGSVAELAESDAVGICFDTGNAYLSGNEPHEWLEEMADRVIHIHAKDIPEEDAPRLRGSVRGMLGCACGEGVIDWARVIAAAKRAPRAVVLSVECDSPETARRSLAHLEHIRAAEAANQ